MNKLYTMLFLCAITFSVKAQQAAIPEYEPYGKVNTADLEMKACDFEKDANAEVLIDKGDVYYDQTFNIINECHRRIKFFNDNVKDMANIHLRFYNKDHAEYITGLQAETINLTDGKVEITKLDKKLVYTQAIDKYWSELVFTMPNVKAGSIIEYKYTWNSVDWSDIPTWNFQDKVPVRYSEYDTNIPEYFYFSTQTHALTPYAIRETKQSAGTLGSGTDAISYSVSSEKRVMVNLPSLADEPFMSSRNDNLESVSFHLTSFRPPYSMVHNINDTWAKVGGYLADNEDFGDQLRRKLAGEDVIIAKAKALKTDDEKIAYLFNVVQSTMKWNSEDQWYTIDGTSEAWDKKSGNATEINLILYHLLNKSGVTNAMPMVTSTREHGKVNPVYTFTTQFNRAVVYIPVDSTKYYVLDASNKYNMYSELPYEVLNSSALWLNMKAKTFDLVFIAKNEPVKEIVFINAEIKPDGKLAGTADISCTSYNRINNIDSYKTDGEKKFIDHLCDGDNNLKIASLKFENMDVDSLPLIQHINFDLNLSGSDDNYIYFNPNLFTTSKTNPFLNETRSTNIDFGYQKSTTINGMYKIPAGYKVDAMPKNISMSLPDKSITFRRIMLEQDGTIAVRYSINYSKSIYYKEQYADIHEFFKKMYEMLNEQIVLKKS